LAEDDGKRGHVRSWQDHSRRSCYVGLGWLAQGADELGESGQGYAISSFLGLMNDELIGEEDDMADH